MGPWQPRGNKIWCSTHDVEFPRGHVCPHLGCSTDESEADDTPVLDASGLPTTVEHERWFVALSDELANLGRVGDASVNEQVKAFDGAIKARRAAVELARYREDWHNTARLEEAVRELRKLRDPVRAGAAQPAQGSVRH